MAIYEIQVQSKLNQGWEQWFDFGELSRADGLDVTLAHASGREPTSSSVEPVTTLTGPVVDQAALRGLLCKLWDLNLTVVSVRRIKADKDEELL